MKVKVGNKIYDGNKEPVMVILSDYDKSNISNMLPECTKYASFPIDCDGKEIEEWMAKVSEDIQDRANREEFKKMPKDSDFCLNPDAPLTKYIRDFKANGVSEETRKWHTEYHHSEKTEESTQAQEK